MILFGNNGDSFELDVHIVDMDNPHSVTGEQVGAMEYVDRGDPDGFDFDKNDFITDLTWRDLDLSSIVPTGVSLIHLRARLATSSLAGLNFRKKGNANGANAATMKIQVANVYYYEDFLVTCDSNRIIQYLASNVSWSVLDIMVRGWFIA